MESDTSKPNVEMRTSEIWKPSFSNQSLTCQPIPQTTISPSISREAAMSLLDTKHYLKEITNIQNTHR